MLHRNICWDALPGPPHLMMSPSRVTLVTRLPVRASTAFSFLTDPAHIRFWWAGPGGRVVNVQIDARDEGLFWVAATPEGGPGRSDYGRFTCVVPNELIEADWSHDATTTSQLIIQLVPLGDQTEISLNHRALPDPAAREVQEQHWRAALAALAAYAATCAADAIDREDSAT